jgi:hypothetical protein
MPPRLAPAMRAWTVLAALLLAGCAGGGSQDLPDCGNGRPLENVDRTYRLCVPAGWTYQAHWEGQELFLYAPPDSAQDPFRENVILARERVADNVTLDEYVRRNLDSTREVLSNFTVIARTNTTLGGEDAVRVSFAYLLSQRLPDGNVTGMVIGGDQTLALHDRIAYVVTFTAEAAKQGVHQQAADSVAASLRFLS